MAEKAPNAPNLKAEHLFAVIRLDIPDRPDLDRMLEYPGDYFIVKEVLPTEEEADREVERLNAVNVGKNCVYWSTITRFYPTGRALDAD
jgi:hypothetical protein